MSTVSDYMWVQVISGFFKARGSKGGIDELGALMDAATPDKKWPFNPSNVTWFRARLRALAAARNPSDVFLRTLNEVRDNGSVLAVMDESLTGARAVFFMALLPKGDSVRELRAWVQHFMEGNGAAIYTGRVAKTKELIIAAALTGIAYNETD